jgi:hypothetical protein
MQVNQGNPKMRTFAAIVACTALLGGCATITRGTTEAWSVQTEPVGANIKLSSGEQCKSPCTLQKKRKDPFQVTIDLDGYQQVVTQVISSVKGEGAAGMAGNVLIGGLIGIGVDVATGAAKDLTPNPLIVKLAPAGSGQTATIETPPPPPPSRQIDDAQRAARLSSYGVQAKSELAKMHCATDFKFVRLADGVETYQATCDDGRVQSMQCDSAACKPVK